MDTIAIVQRVIDFVEEQLDERLELERIAKAAMMSVPHLYRVFYAMTGHPIKEYIRKRRISEAAILLRYTGHPIMDICFRCGFDSYQAFTKSFKRITGLTPGVYRKAGLIYSFERVNLQERLSYLEDREVSERFPDVKVIRLQPLKTFGYLHTENSEEGLEEAALNRFRRLLAGRGVPMDGTRLFGYNVETNGAYGYQMMAFREDGGDGRIASIEADGISEATGGVSDTGAGEVGRDEVRGKLVPLTFPGGLYAVARIPAGSGPSIVAGWNRLLSEWLPRSTFILGGHGFLEEYQQFNGKVSRMKLYLPVARSTGQETIEIGERPPVAIIAFRAKGADSPARSDEQAAAWLTRNGLAGDGRLQLFMTCSYGIPVGDEYEYMLGIGRPYSESALHGEVGCPAVLGGGLYACLTTGAYGSMTGVLDRMYRWLGQSPDYAHDDRRSWFTRYIPGTGTDLDRTTTVECCIPVVPVKTSEEG